VVHSAASYRDPNDWVTDALVNVIGTINIVQASEIVGVKRNPSKYYRIAALIATT
jgi:UDP-glucose 4-epimerase